MRNGKKSNCSEHIAAFIKENTMNTRIKSTAIAVAVAGLFAAQSAAAADTHTLKKDGFWDGSKNVTIYNTPSPVGGNPTSVSAGGFKMKDLTAGGSFQAWCVDIFSWMASSTSYTLTPGNTFFTPTKATALERLASNNLASVTNNATNSAAFQLAVWEIVNETSGTYNVDKYNASKGSFYATSSSTLSITTANNWLSSLGSATPTLTLSVWKETPGYPTQDLAVFAPVPEPETYAMMLAGLGLMGFVARRRKQNAAA